jgi:uncharacterized protein YkwD
MNRKQILSLMLAAMILAACSPAPAETGTAEVTVIPDASVTSVSATEEQITTEPSATPTSLSTSTSTPEPPRPTNVANCTNSATFITDVTIPDNTEVTGGTAFVKTWRVMNDGTCIWASDYTLTYYSDERMSAPASVPLTITYPGQTLDISVPLTAPNVLGTHRGNFVIKNAEGLIMKIGGDSRLWLIINVKSLIAATVVSTSAAGGQTPSIPAATVSSSGTGFANVSCAYTLDQTKVNEVITAVNAYRATLSLPAYTTNPQLSFAAQAHANDMACNNLFVHTGSNGSTIQSRVEASGYVAASVSENVYGSYPPLTGQGVVNWWKTDKTDPRHNLNLVSDKFINIGVGYAFFNNYGYYVIVFATP